MRIQKILQTFFYKFAKCNDINVSIVNFHELTYTAYFNTNIHYNFIHMWSFVNNNYIKNYVILFICNFEHEWIVWQFMFKKLLPIGGIIWHFNRWERSDVKFTPYDGIKVIDISMWAQSSLCEKCVEKTYFLLSET